MEDSQIVKAPTFNKCFKVEQPISLLQFLLVFVESPFLGSLFGCRSHVVETREEAAGLSCDD